MRTTYGQRRDYRKIDLYLSGEYICTKYICSTTWARTLTEAREALRLERQGQAAAHFASETGGSLTN